MSLEPQSKSAVINLVISIAIALLFTGCFPISKLQYVFGDYPNDVFKTLPKRTNIH